MNVVIKIYKDALQLIVRTLPANSRAVSIAIRALAAGKKLEDVNEQARKD